MPVPVCVREYVIFLKRTITGVIRAYKRLKESFRESFKESLKRKLYGPTCLRPKDWVQITFRSEIISIGSTMIQASIIHSLHLVTQNSFL